MEIPGNLTPNRTAMPTSSPIVYFPKDSRLAERWLSSRSADDDAVVFLPAESATDSERLRAKFPLFRFVRNLDGLDRNGRIVLPIPVESRPLVYYPTTSIPDWTPLYSLVRSFWLEGFREFEFFSLSGSRKMNIPFLMDHFVDRHKGKRCFVVGNGPSLNSIDMSLLQNEITLGSNRCYLGFEKWGFPFTYWGVGDWLQIEEYGSEYEQHLPESIPKFFSMEYLPLLQFENPCPFPIDNRFVADPRFSTSPEQLYLGSTVTYLLLQIAALMGCDPIILIGVDHRFEFKQGVNDPLSPFETWKVGARRKVFGRIEGTFLHLILKSFREARRELKKRRGGEPARKDFWTSSDAVSETHFDPRYVEGEAKRFSLPSPEISEKQFDCAARWAKEHGRTILNAAPGSALDSFQKVDYTSLF